VTPPTTCHCGRPAITSQGNCRECWGRVDPQGFCHLCNRPVPVPS
jgi:predicted amidophosphoribosyltransferase